MGEIINLRKARKRRARDAKAEAGAENRVRFGWTKSERALQDEELDRATRRLDGHLLGPPEPAKPSNDDGGSSETD